MNDKYKLFNDKGYVLFKQFIKNDSFNEICNNLKNDILDVYKNTDRKLLGGNLMGNLGVTIGSYDEKIYNLLIQNDLDKIIEQISNNKISDYEIIFGGNLNLPKSYDQHFHPDGSFNNTFIIINLATEDINELNGPLEISYNTHHKKIPYWKFFLSNNKTEKILMSKGDILIRENTLWHRGTKNFSKEPRFLLTLALKINKGKINKVIFEKKNQIKILSNFFDSSLVGKIEEFVYTKLRYFYIFLRLIKSLYK